MAIDRRSPSEVFKGDPEAERGLDEHQFQNTIHEFARKHGTQAALAQLAIAIKDMPHIIEAPDYDAALDMVNKG